MLESAHQAVIGLGYAALIVASTRLSWSLAEGERCCSSLPLSAKQDPSALAADGAAHVAVLRRSHLVDGGCADRRAGRLETADPCFGFFYLHQHHPARGFGKRAR